MMRMRVILVNLMTVVVEVAGHLHKAVIQGPKAAHHLAPIAPSSQVKVLGGTEKNLLIGRVSRKS